jgi:transcriptional regulator with XRE-family HTH domain
MSKQMLVKKVVETVLEVPGLGAQIKAARQARKESLVKLCEQAGISRQYWYGIESESINHPLPLETLREIERALNTSFEVMTSD